MTLKFIHGDPQMIDYTPGADVTAGDVVSLGGTTGACCGVAHHDIPNGTLGALAATGGVYEGINHDNANNYAKVYWDATNKYFTTTATSNALFGFIISKGGGGAGSICRVFHHPFV